MSTFLERIGIFARAPDARPIAEITADIDAELAFHVEESARELGASGLSTDDARAEALRRFGDMGRIRRECARTQMGERIVLQRIQIVLTVVLAVAVVFLFLSNRESRAQAAAERAQSMALIAKLEAEFVGWAGYPAFDKWPPAGAMKPDDSTATYLDSEWGKATLERASASWLSAFAKQRDAWRHGLRVAELLASLPEAQGAEILASIWPELSPEHREQVMKPFVFDGGHPHALEVLALGFEDNATSVKERAVLYLHTYAWKNLWAGEATGSAWFAEHRDRPVADVLRENATRWARDYGGVWLSYGHPQDDQVSGLLEVVANVRPETFAKAGVDLGAILKEAGVCGISPDHFGLLSPQNRARAERVLTWCKP